MVVQQCFWLLFANKVFTIETALSPEPCQLPLPAAKSAEKCYIDHTCLSDLPQADISQFFDECVDFIDLALSFSMGKVFVSCLLGYSRQVPSTNNKVKSE